MSNETAVEKVDAQLTADAFTDLMKGFGGPYDPTVNTTPSITPYLDRRYLADIWASDGLGKKISSLEVDDAVRAGFEVEGEVDVANLTKEAKRLKLTNALKLAGYWANHYGGALVCYGYADGQTVDKPAIAGKELTYIKVYPRSAVYLQPSDLDNDPTSPRYGKALKYPVIPGGVFGGSQVTWHWSRCFEVLGNPIPDDPESTAKADFDTRYWGASCLQGLMGILGTFGISMQSIGAMFREASIATFTLQGLHAMAASKDGNTFRARITNMNYAKSVLNAVVLDAGSGQNGPPAETFSRTNITFTGVPETMQTIEEVICGLTGYPRTKLFGVQLGGLGSKDSSSSRNYDDKVMDMQSDLDPFATDALRRMNAYIQDIPESDPILKWKHPNEPTEMELVEMRFKQMQTDKGYFDMQVVDSDEIRENRFIGIPSLNTVVEGEAPNNPAPQGQKPPKIAMKKPAKKEENK